MSFELCLEKEEKKKGLHTHLFPQKKEVREVDERARSWAGFYNGPKLPHFHRHPLQQ